MLVAGSAESQAFRQLATLNRIARIAVQDMAMRPMLQRIVDMLAEEFDWDFVACATVDRARGEFVCQAVCGNLESEVSVGYRRALGSGVVGRCAATGLSIDVPDARGDPSVVDTLHGTGSELCVPVLHNGEVLAVLNAESRHPGAFAGQRELLETVADQVAGILRAANLVQQLQRANGELREAYAALETLSEIDALTGIANRRRFDAWLVAAANHSATGSRPMCLLMIDVDCFKSYNDACGHQAGDRCLGDVAALLTCMLQDTPAKLARYGGEEFVVIVPDIDEAGAIALAERLRRGIEARALPHPGEGGVVTISIGAASGVPAHGGGGACLLTAADGALYEAKRGGRNQVVFRSSA